MDCITLPEYVTLFKAFSEMKPRCFVKVLEENSFIFITFYFSVAAYCTILALTSVSVHEIWTPIHLFLIRC